MEYEIIIYYYLDKNDFFNKLKNLVWSYKRLYFQNNTSDKENDYIDKVFKLMIKDVEYDFIKKNMNIEKILKIIFNNMFDMEQIRSFQKDFYEDLKYCNFLYNCMMTDDEYKNKLDILRGNIEGYKWAYEIILKCLSQYDNTL